MNHQGAPLGPPDLDEKIRSEQRMGDCFRRWGGPREQPLCRVAR